MVDAGPTGGCVCRPAGKLRLKGHRSTNPVAVGDQVDFEVEEDGTGVIRRIEACKNCIVRKSVNLSHESHVVAANLDRAFLVVTPLRRARAPWTGFWSLPRPTASRPRSF